MVSAIYFCSLEFCGEHSNTYRKIQKILFRYSPNLKGIQIIIRLLDWDPNTYSPVSFLNSDYKIFVVCSLQKVLFHQVIQVWNRASKEWENWKCQNSFFTVFIFTYLYRKPNMFGTRQNLMLSKNPILTTWWVRLPFPLARKCCLCFFM